MWHAPVVDVSLVWRMDVATDVMVMTGYLCRFYLWAIRGFYCVFLWYLTTVTHYAFTSYT